MNALRHHAKREDDGFDRVIVLRTHTSKPFPRAACCPDQKPCTSIPKNERETRFARPVDMHGLRRCFPQRWGAFCRSHFRNGTDLAAFFDVEERTAQLWLNGKHAPAAAFVLRAVAAFPDAVAMLSEGDC